MLLLSFHGELSFALNAEFTHQHGGWAKAGKRALKTIEAEEQRDPGPVRVVEDG